MRVESGEYSATIAAVGGGLRAATFQGQPLVETYDGLPPLFANVVLAPWPNRVGNGSFSHGGQEYSLPLNEQERGNALHGLVGEKLWDLHRLDDSKVIARTKVTHDDGWPWTLSCQTEYRAVASGIEATFTVQNLSLSSSPFAYGIHLYLNALGAPADDCTLYLSSERCEGLDSQRLLPTGETLETRDVLGHGQVRGAQWDHCFVRTPLTGGLADAGNFAAVVNSEGRGTRLDMDPSFGWVHVFTADPAHGHGYPGRGRAIAVEPMTAPIDALRSGRGLKILVPGAKFRVRWKLSAIDTAGGLPA